MRYTLPVLAIALALALAIPSGVGAQMPVDWDPARPQVTRAELEDLLTKLDAVVSSDGYSSGIKNEARRAATVVRDRLENGDFRIGDRIWLSVTGETLPDTLVVESGPSVRLEQMGTISLRGVLRSELEDHMQKELSRWLKDPSVRASSTIRISVEGDAPGGGFFTFPAEMLLTEALMRAGGTSGLDLEDIKLQRGTEVLMEGQAVREALDDGRTLDQLNLIAGDRIVLAADTPSRIWPTVLRWGAVIASTMLLGIRIYR